MTNKLKLSIAMIVKNEERNLRRCLDSFLPIINKKWCDLVIVDTGSTDNTLLVAKEYADSIYTQEHNFKTDGVFSFSEARNYSIDMCQPSKFIMIVDADEALSQASLYRLIDMFEDETLDFNTAFIQMTNYIDSSLQGFSTNLSPRVFRVSFNNEQLRYSGRIHNKANGIPPYLDAGNVEFLHYGYLFGDNKELADHKTERSLPVLESDHKENDHDLHTLTHIIKTVCSVNRHDECIEYGKLWKETVFNTEWHNGLTAYLEALQCVITSYLAKGDLDGAIDFRDGLDDISKEIPLLDMQFAEAFVHTNDEEKAAEYFERAFKKFCIPKSFERKLLVDNTHYYMPKVLNWLAMYYMEKGDSKKSGEFLNLGIRLNGMQRLDLKWDIYNAINHTKQKVEA